LKSWRAFAKAGGKGAMTAHNTVLNRPCHAHPWLVNEVFRKEFSFGDGIIVSDCNDIEALVDFRVAKNNTYAAAAALIGGVDLDLQCGGNSAYTELGNAIASGLVNTSTLDLSVRRVLLAKFAVGLFDHPLTDESLVEELNNPTHRALALRAAEEGIVMLINKGVASAARVAGAGGGSGSASAGAGASGESEDETDTGADGRARPDGAIDRRTTSSAPFLPLPMGTKKIAVLGPNGGCAASGTTGTSSSSVGSDASACAAAMNMLGSYTQYGHNPGGKYPVEVPTVYDALKAAYTNSTVEFLAGASFKDTDESSIPAAVALAEASDVAVVVVGDNLQTSSEWGDRDSLDLPGSQLALLEAVAATNTPVILVTITGRTPSFGGPANAVLANVTAMFAAFRPGQMGGVAVANLISGKTNPSGKLAQSWVRSAGQAMSGAAPFLQWRVGKWVANKRGPADPDGRHYDPYNTHAGAHPTSMRADDDDGRSSAYWFSEAMYSTAADGTIAPVAPSEASPLFRFGDGLSYTTFTMSTLSAGPVSHTDDTVMTLSVKVTNMGTVPGTEVIQVYCEDPVMAFVRPWKRLLTFARVTLQPGASTTVRIPVTRDEMMFYDDDLVLALVPGEYTLSAGGSSYSAAALTVDLVV
jgi:beta-glucosidase